jgi:hypothetical protein
LACDVEDTTGAVPAIFYGGNVITLVPGMGSSTFYTGVYRTIGALYTDSSSDVVEFTQQGDRLDLKAPVKDIDTDASVCIGAIGNAQVTCPLSLLVRIRVAHSAACSTGRHQQAVRASPSTVSTRIQAPPSAFRYVS